MPKKEDETEEEKLFTICPVCGSPSIYQALGMITGQHYKCPDCNYSGTLVVEGNEKMVREIREKYNKNKKDE
ncbi:hypothetical protein [Methanonatronarchaeum sp. AMET6-2]|uniref:hypothetical protein n=1 Tax=Methanonatronarchaeum sp. AMET6-2 TaxID=2933293 RepID=UPI00120504BB|nr:hypothetical protein [Methanonatronarchaeum sp. AMET6-2]RZN61989.1 MAG: hypothetical protein EF811_03970 [Methanonatronarchaeia archaeon]UOY09481.1 hypothetical protein MU439_04305 [Methanonatronarchaeum sp. AMET6-2]